MTALTAPSRLTAAEYLAREEAATERSEFLNGEVLAMAGGTEAHSLIAGEIYGLLFGHLRGQPCRVYNSDMAVEAENLVSHAFFYPDVTVSCEPRQANRRRLLEPRLIFEVASPSTKAFDYSEKRRLYCSLPSVEVFVIVESDKIGATVFRRAPGAWHVEDLTAPTDLLDLPTLGFRVPLGRLYERVAWGEEPPAPAAPTAPAP